MRKSSTLRLSFGNNPTQFHGLECKCTLAMVAKLILCQELCFLTSCWLERRWFHLLQHWKSRLKRQLVLFFGLSKKQGTMICCFFYVWQTLQPYGSSEWIQEQIPVYVRSQTMEFGLEKGCGFVLFCFITANFMGEYLHIYINPLRVKKHRISFCCYEKQKNSNNNKKL